MNEPSAGTGWQQIAVTTTRAALAEAVFEHFDASAVSVLDADDEPTIERILHTHPAFETARVVGLFGSSTPPESVTRELTRTLGDDVTIEVKPLAQQD